MKLIVKFNLVLLLVFAAGLLGAGYVSFQLLQRNARDEIIENARVMMASSLAMRTYTNKQIKPLLDTQMKYRFLPQSVPAYAATEHFNELRAKFPEYAYKEATLNPTNPRDRASDWEADIVNTFRQSPTQTELIGERDTPNGPSLYLARPLQIKDPACLICHSTVSVAPKTMIDQYGNANGFGWQLGEIIGAQVVSVPMAVPIKRAQQTFKVFMILLTTLAAFLFISLNILLVTLVVRRVKNLAQLADQVSLGDMNAPEFSVTGNDEIATLSRSFNRMRKSLVQALKMLEV